MIEHVDQSWVGDMALDIAYFSRVVFDASRVTMPKFVIGSHIWSSWLVSEFIVNPAVDVVDITASRSKLGYRHSHKSSSDQIKHDLAFEYSGLQYRI